MFTGTREQTGTLCSGRVRQISGLGVYIVGLVEEGRLTTVFLIHSYMDHIARPDWNQYDVFYWKDDAERLAAEAKKKAEIDARNATAKL